jgi:hypothetical protein
MTTWRTLKGRNLWRRNIEQRFAVSFLESPGRGGALNKENRENKDNAERRERTMKRQTLLVIGLASLVAFGAQANQERLA